MLQNKKDLLLKDICARLPYGVKVRYSSYEKFITCTLQAIDYVYNNVDLWNKDACFNPVNISKIKPYLFPLSSMTEEQLLELSSISFENSIDSSIKTLNWCYKNHFDIYNLIPMGLAIDATGLNIY